MARPLRLEFAGALYHITSRGDRREAIYRDDEERQEWLEVRGQVYERFNWVIHGYCQMTNHYHLVAETVEGHLSRGMRQLNGLYTQQFNRRHHENGHLFQGRYKAILVQKDSHLLELTRYVVLNPVRAGMVTRPEDWVWSSYRVMIHAEREHQWLDVDWTLSQFGHDRTQAIAAYRQFVMAGKGLPDPKVQVKHQMFLGNDAFIAAHQQAIEKPETLREVSKAHKRAVALSLSEYQSRYPQKDEAMVKAYLSGAYTMAEIGRHFNIHYMTVSRAVKKYEER
jgi:REP element-mobilizing transposase RayT